MLLQIAVIINSVSIFILACWMASIRNRMNEFVTYDEQLGESNRILRCVYSSEKHGREDDPASPASNGTNAPEEAVKNSVFCSAACSTQTEW
ncbi:hypothetical protein [Bifidobacterium myosotis]|uniref:Uncharacterized protein n=1 Tax=Bifidobacterium myosotis TaxID=1630166 RepID=A0A5M9ZHU0_9BIFI|nr:hypothetical protein [Bifidobacterium myosotis]KAA8827191.1 hypothetical protein EMO91_09060 [Bifidobacterium myosotis]